MRMVSGLSIALLLAAGAFAQHRGGFSSPQPFTRCCGAQPAAPFYETNPIFGSRVGLTVAGHILGGQEFRRDLGGGGAWRGGAAAAAYAYPVYVGYYGMPYMPYAPEAGQPDQVQPNILIIYPPPPAPVVINPSGGAESQVASAPPESQPVAPQEPERATVTTSHYLIALNDHTVDATVAYLVDGDTLRYVTSSNIYKKVPLSKVDRVLTKRLNNEAGLDMTLPEASPTK